jgi:hypothetical protein
VLVRKYGIVVLLLAIEGLADLRNHGEGRGLILEEIVLCYFLFLFALSDISSRRGE